MWPVLNRVSVQGLAESVERILKGNVDRDNLRKGVLGDLILEGSNISISMSDAGVMTISASGSTGANSSLSNLDPTAINVNLKPGIASDVDLGTILKPWGNLFVNTIGATGTRITKGWFTDLEVTNAIVGNITGNAGGNAAGLSSTLAVTSGGTGTTNGSITGTGALTMAAGGSDQNLTLNPSGIGSVVASNVGAGIPLVACRNQDSDTVVNVIDCKRLGVSNQPGAGFGGKIIFNLGGHTPTNPVNCGSIGAYWENAQTNDTTDRDTTILLRNMKNNALQDCLSVNSALNLSGPVSITIGANTLDTNEWAVIDGCHLGFTSFVPSWTNLTVGNGTNAGWYKQSGKAIEGYVVFTFGSTSSISGSVALTLPVTISSNYANKSPIGEVVLVDASGSDYSGAIQANGGLRSRANSSGNIILSALSSTAPFTWTTGDQILICFVGEAA